MNEPDLEKFNKSIELMDNLWVCYRQFLKDSQATCLPDTGAQFLIYLETTRNFTKDNFSQAG